MSDILRIESASKSFQAPEGGLIRALDDVSLEIARNEFLTLLGPSGCGKTTLLRAVSGFEILDAGEIYIDGRAMGNLAAHKRPVNTVFQRYALFPHLSVARNVSYSLDVSGVAKAEIAARVGQMLELVGLVEARTISSSAAQQVFAEMFETGKPPAAIVQEKGLAQVSDTGAIEKICDEVIAANPGPAADFRAGKAAALNFLKGQVMKLSKGKANPGVAGEILEKKLKS